MYTDEQLDYWGDRFIAERIRSTLGITFERFLNYPRHYVRQARRKTVERFHAFKRHAEELMATTDRATIGDFDDLLPAQAAIRQELDIADLPRRNGAAIEPLKHHRHPRHTSSSFPVHQEQRS